MWEYYTMEISKPYKSVLLLPIPSHNWFANTLGHAQLPLAFSLFPLTSQLLNLAYFVKTLLWTDTLPGNMENTMITAIWFPTEEIKDTWITLMITNDLGFSPLHLFLSWKYTYFICESIGKKCKYHEHRDFTFHYCCLHAAQMQCEACDRC